MLFTELSPPQRLTMLGAYQTASFPTNTNKVRLAAEGGDLRYTLDGTNALVTSSGYLPAGNVVWLNISSNLSVYGATGAYANILYIQAQ